MGTEQGSKAEHSNTESDLAFVDTIRIGKLTESPPGAVLKSNTEVSIFASPDFGQRQIELVFHMPLKRSTLGGLLKRFSSTPFRPGALADFWSGKDNGVDIVQDPFLGMARMIQEREPAIKKFGKALGEVADSEDDSPFISYIQNNLQTHSEAWMRVLRSRDVVSQLLKWTRGVGAPVHEGLIEWLKQFPAVQGKRSTSQSSDEPISPANFFQKSTNERIQFLQNNIANFFGSFEEVDSFEQDVIRQSVGIHEEFSPSDGERMYMTGNDKKIEILRQSGFEMTVHKEEQSARVVIEDDGSASVMPSQASYVIPILGFVTDKNSRHLSLDDSRQTLLDSLTIPRPDGKVEVVYQVDRGQFNPLAGLILMHDLLEVTQPERVRSELLPYAALYRSEKIFGKRFFDKIERLI